MWFYLKNSTLSQEINGLKYILNIFFIIGLVLFTNLACASDKQEKTVNILTWWGYLDYPEINSLVETKCNVKLSVDEYYSNTEFLRRWEEQKQTYDVVIFSDTIYDVVKNEVSLKGSPLWRQSFSYNPIVKKHYDNDHFPSNIVFFMHSLTGFLWNSEVITLSSNDSIYTMFEKAKNKLVVIIDDPVEARKLISLGYYEAKYGNSKYALFKDKLLPLTLDNFKQLAQKSNVYITNDYNELYKNKDFAFSFTWSGEAIVDLKKAKENYKFLIHPKLSYVSSDLLANLNSDPAALCVSKELTSKEVASLLQNRDGYFSPYVDDRNVTDPFFKKIYEIFITNLNNLAWIHSVSHKEFSSLGKTWDIIRLEFNR